MTPRCLVFVLAALLSPLPAAVAGAHHAFTPVYDGSRTVTIKGTLTEFKLVNPHAKMTLDVVDETGKRVAWTVEMAGLLSLSRQGWTETTVSVGQQLTVTGNPTHTGSAGLFFTRLVMPDGTERIAPGSGDLSAVEEQRLERARQRDLKK
jgi:hypothetical protein